ncbi:hypothetical protein I312_105654 [Cryptococcus bacillisporus CA1280]|uniref:uncharacterized protein n=1 Tax=Cryptococcus bacillisporus CA1280 TaxID=1296109 RepID=UPI00336740C1
MDGRVSSGRALLALLLLSRVSAVGKNQRLFLRTLNDNRNFGRLFISVLQPSGASVFDYALLQDPLNPISVQNSAPLLAAKPLIHRQPTAA